MKQMDNLEYLEYTETEETKLNVYNSNAKCPKCGCVGIKNRFCPKGTEIELSKRKSLGGGCFRMAKSKILDFNCIKRECFNCGYIWFELSLDTDKEE